ncbi:tRNA-splicing endonuclease subunit Sen34 [Sergentomyia squamirostris]
METNPPISIKLINNRGFIFNANDYMTLRRKHRIAAVLMGCCVNNPRNTSIGGLPAVLSQIELKFLLERQLVTLEDNSLLKHAPIEETVQKYRDFTEKQYQEQKTILKEKRVQEVEQNLQQIIRGKKKKMLKSGVKEENIDLDEDQIFQEEIQKIPQLTKEYLLVQTPKEHPWPRDDYPLRLHESAFTPRESLKYRIFADLYDRGYFLTSGSTFGGDFLLYPGDPILFHASHVVHVLLDHRVDSRHFTACNRLCVGVKKSCVFALEDSSGKIIYYTSRWDAEFRPE